MRAIGTVQPRTTCCMYGSLVTKPVSPQGFSCVRVAKYSAGLKKKKKMKTCQMADEPYCRINDHVAHWHRLHSRAMYSASMVMTLHFWLEVFLYWSQWQWWRVLPVLKSSLQVGGHWKGMDSVRSLCSRQATHKWILLFQHRYLEGTWLGAQLQSNTTTTPSHGTGEWLL